MFGDIAMKCALQQSSNVTLNTNHTHVLITRKNLKYILIPKSFLLTFVLTTNLMLIYGFYKTSRPFTIITKLFIYLSVVDNAMIFLRTLYAFQEYLTWQFPCYLIHTIVVLMEFLYLYGLDIFATISFLRYWSIYRPLHSIKEAHLLISIIVGAILCGSLPGGLLIAIYLKKDPREMVRIFYFVPIAQFLTVFFVLCVNLMSYKKLKSMKIMSGLSDNVENSSTQRQKKLSEANTCLLYITAFYIIFPLPLFTLGLYAIVQDNLMATTGSG